MGKLEKKQGGLEKKPITPTLKNMKLGDSEHFPIRKVKTVRSTTGYLHTVFGLAYKTKQLNDLRLVEVIRIK